MSTKIIFPCTLILAVLTVAAVSGQDYRGMPAGLTPPSVVAPDGSPALAPVPPDTVPPPQTVLPGLSQWIVYQRPDCCGHVGYDGPIYSELYVLTGFEIPAQGKIFGKVLETGWVLQGGGRTLFFNPAMDCDWNIDLSISNIFNRGQRSDVTPSLNLPGSAAPVPFSIKDANRTYVNAAFGREWYFHRPADAWIQNWRIGLSAGGRLGSEKVQLFQTTTGWSFHRTDVISGLFAVLNVDTEIPCGCCTFLAGMRFEWGYTWSDILQQQNLSDLQDINILFTAGVRF
jgi:hypothetical protein